MREQTEEVDDVEMTMTSSTGFSGAATGLSSFVAAAQSAHTAPKTAVQGTGLPFAGSAAALTAAVVPAAAAARTTAQVAANGARVIDLPGSPPRGAPV